MRIKLRKKDDHSTCLTLNKNAAFYAHLGGLGSGWVEESSHGDTLGVYLTTLWELVPEERWEDVTGALKDTDSCNPMSEYGHQGWWAVKAQHEQGYRLVKRSLWECLPEVARELIESEFKYCSWMTTLHNTDVLKVERKVSA